MNNKKLDIIEIALKEDLKISLDPNERAVLDSMDDEFKKEIFDLVNNEEYLDEIEKMVDHIIKESSQLPKEVQTYIQQKCQERIHKLKYPSLSSEAFNVKTNK